jgi:hypothetical protein
MGNLRDELLAIRAQAGELTPEIVVEAATPEDHPLHDRFEWDDTEAARRYRLVQGGELLRAVRVSLPSRPDTSVRGLLAVRHSDSRRADYMPTEEVMGNPLLAAIQLRDAERDWKLLRARYEHLAEFADMIRRDVA